MAQHPSPRPHGPCAPTPAQTHVAHLRPHGSLCGVLARLREAHFVRICWLAANAQSGRFRRARLVQAQVKVRVTSGSPDAVIFPSFDSASWQRRPVPALAQSSPEDDRDARLVLTPLPLLLLGDCWAMARRRRMRWRWRRPWRRWRRNAATGQGMRSGPQRA